MPMNFPDMDALKDAARVHKFRAPHEGELEIEYRMALADHVRPIDLVESQEIRTGKGWDQWDDENKSDLIKRGMFGK